MSDQASKPNAPEKGITRIPLKSVTFRQSEDIPGQGYGETAGCGDDGSGRAWLFAVFIPALQVVQFEFRTKVVADQQTFMVPCSDIKRMVLE